MGMPEDVTNAEIYAIWMIRVVVALTLIMIINYMNGCH